MNWDMAEAVTHYKKQGAPAEQTALVNLLREAQQENGGSIPGYLTAQVAEALGVKESFLLALIKRFPSLKLGGSHCLELCAGPNCPKRAPLAAFVEATWGRKPKKFTVKYVPCMRLCGKGPNIRWDGKLYHEADEKLLRQLIDPITNGGK